MRRAPFITFYLICIFFSSPSPSSASFLTVCIHPNAQRLRDGRTDGSRRGDTIMYTLTCRITNSPVAPTDKNGSCGCATDVRWNGDCSACVAHFDNGHPSHARAHVPQTGNPVALALLAHPYGRLGRFHSALDKKTTEM